MKMEDALLLGLARRAAKDPKALEEFCVRLYPIVRKAAESKIGRSGPDADDLTQRVMVVAAFRFGQIRTHVLAWVAAILRSKFADLLKEFRRDPVSLDIFEAEEDSW